MRNYRFVYDIVLTIIFFVSSVQISFASKLIIARNGISDAKIVVDQNAPSSVQLAASELKYYIEKSTGASLPICNEIEPGNKSITILLGVSSYTQAANISTSSLKDDGFKIVCKNNILGIIGKDYNGPPIYGLCNPWQYNEVYNPHLKLGAFGSTGTLNGVYHFLEKYLGIRWYMPDEIGTVIPKTNVLKIPLINYTICPDFEYRYAWFCNFADSNEGAMWYKRAGFGAACPVQAMHSFEQFLKYKDSHPEYFALIDGQRDFSNLSVIMGGGNLCLSNPSVAEQWAEDIIKYFDENPSHSYFPLAPGDGMKRICECQRCQSQIDPNMGIDGKFSNYIWSFINKVAEKLAKKYPEKKVCCIAYEGYNAPPTSIEKLSLNVAVFVCKVRAAYSDEQYKKLMNEKLSKWRTIASNVYTWEYYLYSDPPWKGFPINFAHNISQDLESLKGRIKGEFIQAEIMTDSAAMGTNNAPAAFSRFYYSGMRHLNLYVTAKLYWNANLDVDELLAEYYEKFYGPAADQMKNFWTKSEQIWMSHKHHSLPIGEIGADTIALPFDIFTAEDMKTLTEHLEQARQLSKTQPIYSKRIELVSSEFEIAKKTISKASIPSSSCSKASAPIKIDGVLDEGIWNTSSALNLRAINGDKASYQTEAYTAWDSNNIYFAFKNTEPNISKLNSYATKRDQNYSPAMWEDDSVEIFISPDPNNRSNLCYQFIINTKGVVWDGVYGGHKEFDLAWNSDIKSATLIGRAEWTLEVSIPFKDLGIAPAQDKTFAVNIYRNRYADQGLVDSAWSLLCYNHYSPSRFGLITLSNESRGNNVQR
ncbi:MAG: hypothetical protein A2Y12_09450 [Planctomycetes bacterium GWF2_42_9]|nr:MAG: hypothetical protein A2Y12_09450 [Planctomycetes bacterium GWF2_42_9]